jgi:hypothetical protein
MDSRTMLHLTRSGLRPEVDTPESHHAFRAKLLDLLAKVGVATDQVPAITVDELARLPPHTLISLARDDDGEVELFAVPDAEIGADDRAALDAMNGAYFELFFGGDLRADQYVPALRLLGWLSRDGEVFGDVLEDLIEDVEGSGVEPPSIDDLRASFGRWADHQVGAGGLGKRLSRFVGVQLAT